MPSQCPNCRGELVVKSSQSTWDVTFSTLTTTASGLDTDSFVLHATLDDSSSVTVTLAANSGQEVGNRTEYFWSISQSGIAESAYILVDHSSLGELRQDMTVSEQSQAA